MTVPNEPTFWRVLCKVAKHLRTHFNIKQPDYVHSYADDAEPFKYTLTKGFILPEEFKEYTNSYIEKQKTKAKSDMELASLCIIQQGIVEQDGFLKPSEETIRNSYDYRTSKFNGKPVEEYVNHIERNA